MSPSDAAWQLLKREIHPGSLAAYRQMVEDLGDNMPVEQRLAQLLGEGKYLSERRRNSRRADWMNWLHFCIYGCTRKIETWRS